MIYTFSPNRISPFWLLSLALLLFVEPISAGFITTDVKRTVAPSNNTGADDGIIRQNMGEDYSVWDEIDILFLVFFVLSAAWLIFALIWSCLILLLLRLQARGQLDIYDESFGRLICCNGYFNLNMTCWLRRIAVRLEMRQQRHNGDDTQSRIHIMTREERRIALETLLSDSTNRATPESTENKIDENPCDGDSNSGPQCTICLEGYGKNKTA
jgi:hypothetical protein